MYFPSVKIPVQTGGAAFIMRIGEKAANFAALRYLIDQLSSNIDNVFANFPSVTDGFDLTI